jgi:hypothetical protein
VVKSSCLGLMRTVTLLCPVGRSANRRPGPDGRSALAVVRVPAPTVAHAAATRSRPGSAPGWDRDHLPDRARAGAESGLSGACVVS